MAGRRSPGRDHSFRARRVKLLVSLLLAAAIFSFLFTRVDVASVWTEIRAMTWFELATIAAVAGWNLVTYWALWVAVTPGLTWPQAMVVAQSGTAVTNTVPGGSGIGVGLTYAMLESWGFSRGRSTLAVLITGVWNNLIKLGLPVLALALLALQGDAGGSRVVGGTVAIGLLAAAIVLFAMVLRRDRVALQVGELAGTAANWLRRLLRRHTVAGWRPATVKFRSRAKEVLRRRWPAITAATLVSHLSLYLVLLTALRHVGVADEAVGWVEVLFVFAFARLVTAVRFTPGGAGVVEALLTTVHAYTATQALVDSPADLKDLRRGRSAAQNFVPSSTGAAHAIAKALPAIQGRFDGVAVRGPVVVGSLSDVVFVLARDTTREEVNDLLRREAETDRYQGVLTVTEEPLVSADIIKDPRASIVQLDLTRVVGGNLVKVMSWYDNEWGFTNQMVQVAVQQLGLDTPRQGLTGSGPGLQGAAAPQM